MKATAVSSIVFLLATCLGAAEGPEQAVPVVVRESPKLDSPALATGNDGAESDESKEYVEPIITDETLPNDPGELSIRLGIEYRERGDEAEGAFPRIQAFYGIFDRVGVELSLPLRYRSGDREMEEEGGSGDAAGEGPGSSVATYGLGDLSLALKCVALKPRGAIPAVVLSLETTFPTGDEDRGLGEGAYELTPFLAVLQDIGPFCVQGNFGWSRQVSSSEGSLESRWVYNWALAAAIPETPIYMLLELNGDWSDDAPDRAAVAPGIKYLFLDNAFVALAVPIGLNRQTDAWGIVQQVQVNF
jgi:hypothetical protein